MAESPITVRRLDAAAIEAVIPQLQALLHDAVAGGASLGFWRPLEADRARRYWQETIAEVAAGERRLLVALRAEPEGEPGQAVEVIGSVQLALPTKQNAARRAEIQKLMVQSAARRHGAGRLLMRAIEQVAAEEGRTTLVLDTNTGSDAEHFYRAVGYHEVGVIPRFSVEADGEERATTVFYKALATAPDGPTDSSMQG